MFTNLRLVWRILRRPKTKTGGFVWDGKLITTNTWVYYDEKSLGLHGSDEPLAK